MARKYRPYVIGLCGRSGSGKSFVARLFDRSGIPTIDTDEIYKEMTKAPENGKLSACMKALVREFGDVILSSDLSLNRKALADIVFADDGHEKRKRLNEITHAYILRETERRVNEFGRFGEWAVIVDAPLLYESGYDKKCDYVVAACAPEDVLIARIVKRDGIDAEAAARRLAVQISDDDLRQRADFVIDTDNTEEYLIDKIDNILVFIRIFTEG